MFRDDFERFTRSFESDLRRLQHEFGDLIGTFRDPRRPAYPALNLWSNDEQAVLTAEVPGVAPAEVEVSVLGSELSVTGKRPGDNLPEGTFYQLQERATGDFHRTVELPFAVDPATVEAAFKDGILTVTLPRQSKERPHRVKINVE